MEQNYKNLMLIEQNKLQEVLKALKQMSIDVLTENKPNNMVRIKVLELNHETAVEWLVYKGF